MTERESKSSSCLKVLGIGCVVVVFLGVLAVGAGVYFIKTRGLDLAASAITAMSEGMLKESQLTDSDKEGVRTEIARFTSRLKAGEISMEQVKKLGDQFEQGSLPALLFLQAVAAGKLVPQGIPEEESAAARLNAQRLQRAAVEGKVTPQELKKILNEVFPREEKEAPKAESESPGWLVDFRDRDFLKSREKEITAEDWRPAMALIKQMADESGIPNEPYQLELTQEIRKLVDQVLSSSS